MPCHLFPATLFLLLPVGILIFRKGFELHKATSPMDTRHQGSARDVTDFPLQFPDVAASRSHRLSSLLVCCLSQNKQLVYISVLRAASYWPGYVTWATVLAAIGHDLPAIYIAKRIRHVRVSRWKLLLVQTELCN